MNHGRKGFRDPPFLEPRHLHDNKGRLPTQHFPACFLLILDFLELRTASNFSRVPSEAVGSHAECTPFSS